MIKIQVPTYEGLARMHQYDLAELSQFSFNLQRLFRTKNSISQAHMSLTSHKTAYERFKDEFLRNLEQREYDEMILRQSLRILFNRANILDISAKIVNDDLVKFDRFIIEIADHYLIDVWHDLTPTDRFPNEDDVVKWRQSMRSDEMIYVHKGYILLAPLKSKQDIEDFNRITSDKMLHNIQSIYCDNKSIDQIRQMIYELDPVADFSNIDMIVAKCKDQGYSKKIIRHILR